MAGTILAKDVLYRVSSQLLDAPDTTRQFSHWTEKELVAWLNDAQRVIAKYLPESCSRVDSIKLVAGQRQSIETIGSTSIINGDGTSSATTRGKKLIDVIRNMGADGSTAGRPIRLISRDLMYAIDDVVRNVSSGLLSTGRALSLLDKAVLELMDMRWHTADGTEVLGYVHDPRMPKYFWVWPAVVANKWVEVAMLANPTEIAYVADSMRIAGGSTTVISIGDEYVDDLVSYMLARAHLKDSEVAGNLQMARAYEQQFLNSVNAQVAAATGVNPNLKTLPIPSQPAATAS